MSELDDILSENTKLRASIGFQGLTPENVGELVLASYRSDAALRKCRSQRDLWASWYINTRDGKLLMPEEQLKDDAELLAILEGKEGK